MHINLDDFVFSWRSVLFKTHLPLGIKTSSPYDGLIIADVPVFAVNVILLSPLIGVLLSHQGASCLL